MTKKITLVIAIFGLSLTLSGAQTATSGEDIFKAHFNPVPLRAMDSSPGYYNVNKSELLRLKKDSADLYRGIDLLKSGKPRQALPYFQKVAHHMKETVSNVSEWYLALTYLKLGKRSQAEYLFHKIADTEIHPHQDEAEVIYQKLVGKKGN